MIERGKYMRSYYHFILIAFGLLFVATTSEAQTVLGFTNANGFPAVVQQAGHYNLFGWIKNSGNVSFTGNLSIQLSANGDVPLMIDNNFAVSTPLHPGDSVYWTKNNYTFPPGRLRANNNGVLIWPTAPIGSDVVIEPIATTIYFTSGSAFRLGGTEFEIFSRGMAIDQKYDITGLATNLGAQPNVNSTCLFASISGYAPRCIDDVTEPVDYLQTARFVREHFCIAEEFGIHPEDFEHLHIDHVDFYVVETDQQQEPFNTISLPLLVAPVGTSQLVDAAGISVYPNPFHHQLTVDVPSDWRADAQLRLMDLSGKLILQRALGQSKLQSLDVPAGTYLLEVSSRKGQFHRPVIVY